MMRDPLQREARRQEKRRYYYRYPEKIREQARRVRQKKKARMVVDPEYRASVLAYARERYSARKEDPEFRARAREQAERMRRRRGQLPFKPAAPKPPRGTKPAPTPEQRRERWRRNRARWKSANPEKVCAADRAYRKRRSQNPEYRAKQSQRRRRYQVRYPEKWQKYSRQRSLRMTAAAQFLRSRGLMARGPTTTTNLRRSAALAYVRAIGLLESLNV